MDRKLLDILACPLCKGHLHYIPEENELLCRFDRIAYPIKNDIPVMIEQQGRLVSLKELDKYKHLN